jgi:small conductance mechanosensitive channel
MVEFTLVEQNTAHSALFALMHKTERMESKMSGIEHALGLAWSTVNKMVDGFFESLPNLLIGVVILLAFMGLSNVVKNLVSRVAHRASLDITLARALGTLCSLLVALLGILTAAVVVIPQFSMVHVIGGLGISSVAIGFAFKDILQNFFAGMLLLWQKPFSIGDQIKTKEFEGTVEDIRIRSTLLRTQDGELVLIPNGDIYTNPVIVSSGNLQKKLTVIAKGTDDVENARTQILRAVSSVDGVAADPQPRAYIADSSVEPLSFEVRFWTTAKNQDMLVIRDKVATKLRQLFQVKEPAKENFEPPKDVSLNQPGDKKQVA